MHQTKKICDSVRISRNRCFIANNNGKCLWFLVGNQVPVPPSPGPTLPVTCHGKRFGVELFEKNKCHGFKKEIECIDNVYVLICIHTWNPNDSNDSSFVSEKDCWLTNWRGREIWSFGPTSGWPSPHTRGPCSWPSGISQARLHLHHPWEIPPGRKTPQPATSICCAEKWAFWGSKLWVCTPRQLWKESLVADYW